uniref:Uncharacterized protein n=1 Tax=Rhizophora mucronata TaxID=61149 RepID=A0A2P2QGC8_RHIMU
MVANIITCTKVVLNHSEIHVHSRTQTGKHYGCQHPI